ncbi:endonuclease MutS2 isoform X4 [Mangifera indica]|uniref:endonuclease MutS2 isoform X4 n=1 Tax=Mangifera indica TaxID=29780 RepID=UPI001CFAB9E8|nr:endonuclease MutS2 isoform X4 [Mangifera indica]
MPLCAVVARSVSVSVFTITTTSISINRSRSKRLRSNFRCFSSFSSNHNKSRALLETLRVLEWDKLCNAVASFARTSLGREATKDQLWCTDQTYQDTLTLQDETNAAVQILKHGACSLDLTGVDLSLVESAVENSRRVLPLRGDEALAVVSLLEFVEKLQLNLKASVKEDAEWYTRFMPLSELIMELVVNRSLIKLIQQAVDEDGSVKDSASPVLRQSRERVQTLERKLFQLMDRLVRDENQGASLLEVSNIDGRWCIKSGGDQLSFKGLLLSSGSSIGSIVEPLSAVPLNDELQQARALAAKAEEDVLLTLTEKMKADLDDIEKILNSVIQLDVVSYLKKEWTLYLPKAYHPLLLQQHKQNLQKSRKDVKNATAEIRRRKRRGENMAREDRTDINLSLLEKQVTALELNQPVPVDFYIAQKTKVLVITGPNTGGKTICLKTVGLAAMMAKSGLYVLSSESAQVPWLDYVFADIGDDQSLSQSLSTFSGHLKQISDIRLQSTSQSLVLLDEVGAGTNPLEGAALGMSLLESFAETGALLTIATTHHGELKTLKYSNDVFENACMEFDEVNLRPTYKILWGVPGRSNAINIAERLGLPSTVVENARELYGVTSAEINEVIIDMERFKQEFQEVLHEARNYLMLSRDLHEKLLVIQRKLMEHGTKQRYKKMREVSEAAAMARSIVHKRARQLRALAAQPSQPTKVGKSQHIFVSNSQQTTVKKNEHPTTSSPAIEFIEKSAIVKRSGLPEVGDLVHISSLGKQGKILRVEPSKEELVVQVGNMKLKLKFSDIVT